MDELTTTVGIVAVAGVALALLGVLIGGLCFRRLGRVRADQRVVGLDVKLSAEVVDRDVRHLHWLREKIGDDLLDAAVITTGTHAYRRADGIAVIPAALLTA